MKTRLHFALLSVLFVCVASLTIAAQESATSPTVTAAHGVPSLISYSGVLKDAGGRPLTAVTGVTFLLYRDEQSGAPLWLETQNVVPDNTGHYTAQLGAASARGIPSDLFLTGEPRWLAVQVAGQPEQPRVLLVAVPYAMKAADAATIGGLPPSAFVLAAPTGSAAATPVDANSNVAPPTLPTMTGSGTPNYLPLWNGTTTPTSTVGNSVLFQSGTGSTAKIGINTTNPGSTLDVKGPETVRGTLNLAAKGTASSTATAGFNSQALDLAASAWNISGTPAANTEHFRWQAEPAGSNTASPSGTLNLLFASGTATPAETGLSVASNGMVNFVPTQTFPGTGSVTSVASGAGLTGGPITGSGTLSIASGGVTNAMLANSSLTVNPGTALTGGGAVSLGGSATLNLDTSQVPLLAANNNFTGNQTVNGNLSATGAVTGSSYQIGSNLFAFGSVPKQNAFLGFAGNISTTGFYNTGSGFGALGAASTGSYNTANGVGALESNTTGSNNTAVGFSALVNNTIGYRNTAVGYQALLSNIGGSNVNGSENTAVGWSALYSNTTGSLNTAFGMSALYSNTTAASNTAIGLSALFNNTTGANNTATGSTALFNNTSGSGNTAVGYSAGTTPNNANFTGSNNTFLGFQSGPESTQLTNATAIGANALVSASNAMVLGGISTNAVNVGIGVTAPPARLTVAGPETTANGYGAAIQLTNTTASRTPNWYFRAGAPGTNTPDGGLTIADDSVYALAITWDGRVGIQTLSPGNYYFAIASGYGPGIADGWNTYSSRRWKTNVQTLHGALSKVEQLRGVTYDRKDSGKHEIGVIAEEVGAVVPEVVSYEKNGKDAQGVDYSRLTALLIEAVKQQQREIDGLRKQLRTQAAKNAVLESRVTELARDRETKKPLASLAPVR